MKRTTELILPEPKRSDRWQPLRSGVLNLYKYDYEEFHYEDGRLLLRGNNGSGKSRVLAMQLPFLLDGEVSPARVEPDGDSAKRIEWNLLMGKHAERTGYSWIEFARRDEAGTCHYLTLGCGMKAVSGHTGLHSRWFFVTPQRVGRDLFLQNSRTPLSRDRLISALGTHGQSYTKTEEYKRAVDQALFGLGPRYGPLIELLLRLRRPQLSRKLEEEELSAALSDALPTLSASIIDEVAESFRSLQTDRETLAEFKSAREGVKAFLDEYTGYIRIVVRRRAAAVRSHHAAYEGAQRDVRDAEARMTAEEEALDQLEEQFGQLETALAGAEATERTLRESPEMKTAQDLQQAEMAANQLAKALEAATQDESRAQANYEQANQRNETSSAEATKVKVKLADAVRLAEVAAEPAGLTVLHRQHLQFDSLLATDGAVVNSAESAIKSALGKRKSAIAALQKREAAVIAAEAAHAKAEASRQQAESDASAARESEKDARTALNSCGSDFLVRYDAWRRDSKLVRSPDGETLEEAFRAWTETRSGESPAQSAISGAYHALLKEFARQEADLKGQLALVQEEQPDVEASEDQGVLMMQVMLPAGSTQEQTGAVLKKVTDYFLTQEKDAVKSVFVVAGFSFGGRGQNAGLGFVKLKDWEERQGDNLKVQAVAGRAMGYFSKLREGMVFAFPPPAIIELGTANGFEYQLIDRSAQGHQALMQARGQLLGLASADPRIMGARPTGFDDVSQYQLDIDEEKASALGVPLALVNRTLAATWGSSYVGDFSHRGRVKRIYMQAAAPFRMNPEDLERWYVPNLAGDPVPLGAFVGGHWTFGSPLLARFNGLPSITIQGQAAPGHSSGEAMIAMEEITRKLPPGFDLAWTGLSYEEKQSGAQAPALYAISLVVVFLCLAALYESWAVPFSVMLVVPIGILGAVLAVFFRGLTNDVYFQVGLLTVVGLSAKNAILIVEFAREGYNRGMSLFDATLLACRQRLRPIIMTSLAFGLGVLPLAIASGAGSGSQNSVGTGVLGGMLTATVLAIFLIPVFYVVVTRLFKVKPLETSSTPPAKEDL